MPDSGSCAAGWLVHDDPQVVDEGLGDLLFAERGVDLGDSPAGEALGTGIGVDAAAPQDPCVNPTVIVTMGVDSGVASNAFGQASCSLGLKGLGTASRAINSSISSGALALLFRIAGYNGRAYDEKVEVDFFHGTTTPPSWDGTDVWSPVEGYIAKVGSSYKAMASAETSVAANWLDLELDEIPGTPPVHRARLRAKISQVNERWHLSGVITGTVSTSDMLRFAGLLGLEWCIGTDMYSEFKDAYCSRADADLNGDGARDALTLAWTFEAESARLGCPVPAAPSPPMCPPAVNPQFDHCGP
jgi:hypothetical protein